MEERIAEFAHTYIETRTIGEKAMAHPQYVELPRDLFIRSGVGVKLPSCRTGGTRMHLSHVWLLPVILISLSKRGHYKHRIDVRVVLLMTRSQWHEFPLFVPQNTLCPLLIIYGDEFLYSRHLATATHVYYIMRRYWTCEVDKTITIRHLLPKYIQQKSS